MGAGFGAKLEGSEIGMFRINISDEALFLAVTRRRAGAATTPGNKRPAMIRRRRGGGAGCRDALPSPGGVLFPPRGKAAASA